MSDNWIAGNLQSALDTWNSKLTEIWSLLTQTPQSFKGGAISKTYGAYYVPTVQQQYLYAAVGW